MPSTNNSKIMLFCNHRTLQYGHLQYYTQYEVLPVENFAKFLSVSLDFFNKIFLPFHLSSVTDSQERLVDDFHNYTYTSDSMQDVLNESEFEVSKLSPYLDENISIESLRFLYIDELPQSVKCIYYQAASTSDDYCKSVVALFYLQLIKLYNYLKVYLEFENKSILNKLVTDIFGEHLSCIPHMTDIVALSVQEIYQINQTLTIILDVAQLLQQYIVSLPQDKQEIITDNIAFVPMADKVKSLKQMLKNEYSKIEEHSTLLHTGKLLKEVLLESNNEDIVDQNYAEEILVPSVFEQQQDVADDSDEKVIIIGTVDYIDFDVNSSDIDFDVNSNDIDFDFNSDIDYIS